MTDLQVATHAVDCFSGFGASSTYRQHTDNNVEGPSNVNVTFRNSTQTDLVGMKRPYPQLRQTQKTVHCSKRRTATCQLQIRLQFVLGQSKSTPMASVDMS